jgi:hypothetical protein
LNCLVLDYLILEGYQTAAQSFAEEAARDLPSNAAQQVSNGRIPDLEWVAHFDPIQVEDASIEARIQIRDAVERGDIQTAIEMCNDLDPEVRQVLLSSLPRIRPFMHHA